MSAAFAVRLGIAALLLSSASVAGKKKWINTFAGPYLLTASRAYMCEDKTMWEPKTDIRMHISHWNPVKPYELQRVDANCTLLTDIDDDQWMYVTVDIRNNNEWKPNAFVMNFPKGGCSFMWKMFPAFMKMLYGAPGAHCLTTKGVYTVRNHSIDWTIPDVPIIPYGEYRINIRAGEAKNMKSRWAFHCQQLEGFARQRP